MRFFTTTHQAELFTVRLRVRVCQPVFGYATSSHIVAINADWVTFRVLSPRTESTGAKSECKRPMAQNVYMGLAVSVRGTRTVTFDNVSVTVAQLVVTSVSRWCHAWHADNHHRSNFGSTKAPARLSSTRGGNVHHQLEQLADRRRCTEYAPPEPARDGNREFGFEPGTSVRY